MAGRKKTNSNGANIGYEAQLWQMADALRGSMDAAEYKHVVLGLIFLKYISDAFEELQVIEELIGLAKDMRAANARGEELGLSDEELAFYDALEVNDSAVKVLGEPTLMTIARELVEAVRKNVTID